MHLRKLVEASWVEFRSSSAHNDYFCRRIGLIYGSRVWIFGKILGSFSCALRSRWGDGAIATDQLRWRVVKCTLSTIQSDPNPSLLRKRRKFSKKNKKFSKTSKHFGGDDIFRKYRTIRELAGIIIDNIKKQRAAEVSSDEKPVGYWMLLSACTPYL